MGGPSLSSLSPVSYKSKLYFSFLIPLGSDTDEIRDTDLGLFEPALGQHLAEGLGGSAKLAIRLRECDIGLIQL